MRLIKKLVFFFVIGIIGVILWLTREIPFCGWDFRDALWGPVSMLVQHQTPYSFNTPYGPYPGTWMPTLLGTFFYFGYMFMISSLINSFFRIMRLFTAICLAVMVVLVFGNVVLRYGFNSGIAFSEEMSRWAFVWLIKPKPRWIQDLDCRAVDAK